MPDNEPKETDGERNQTNEAVNGNTFGARPINRRNVLRATGVGLISSTALTGTSLAKRPPTPAGGDDPDVPTEDELGTFNENAREVPQDELPIESEALGGTVGSQALAGGVTTSSLPECVGFSFESLEAQICPRNDGSIEASVGAFGVVADSLVISPGQAVKTGSARVAIPGLPGLIQEFSHQWTAQWSGTSIEYLHVEITLEAWDFGVGWYQVAHVDQTLIS